MGKDDGFMTIHYGLAAATGSIMEGVEEQVKALQKAQNEGEKEIVRLETELKKK